MQAYADPHYARQKIGRIYPLLNYESLQVQVDNQLIKIDPHKIEYFMLNFFIAVQSVIQQKKGHYEALGVRVDDFIGKLEGLPENVLPAFRKKKEYWLAVLAKHEVDGNNPYNKKLFYRIERGVYVLNPNMKIRYDTAWIPAEEVIDNQGIIYEEMIEHNLEKQRKQMAKMREEMEKNMKRREREEELRKQRYGWYRDDL
jgi:hypothetical protein